MENIPDEPHIARTLRTGEPDKPIVEPLICSVCGEEVPANTVYGVGDNGNVCQYCEDELDKQFKSLTFSEKIIALGMDIKFNG